jgi:hypothetical protein
MNYHRAYRRNAHQKHLIEDFAMAYILKSSQENGSSNKQISWDKHCVFGYRKGGSVESAIENRSYKKKDCRKDNLCQRFS